MCGSLLQAEGLPVMPPFSPSPEACFLGPSLPVASWVVLYAMNITANATFANTALGTFCARTPGAHLTSALERRPSPEDLEFGILRLWRPFREASWNFPRQDRDFKGFRGFPGMELGIFRVVFF